MRAALGALVAASDEQLAENAGGVKVEKAILAEREREFGAESKEAGEALYNLGVAYWHLGDSAMHRDACERALPIFEREHGSDHAEVAALVRQALPEHEVTHSPDGY